MRSMMLVVALLVSVALGPNTVAADDALCIWVDVADSLQARIDAAPAGSILCLPEGTWTENVVITKPLTLRGQGPGRTILRSPRQTVPDFSPVISVRGSGSSRPLSVVIEGLSVIGTPEGVAGAGRANAGVEVLGKSQVVLYNCHVLMALHGVVLLGEAQAYVDTCRFEGSASGLMLFGRSQAVVLQTTLSQVEDGVVANGSAQVVVARSTIERSRFGVHVRDDAQVVVTETTIRDSNDGIVVLHRGGARVTNCTITDNGTGIAVFHHGTVIVEANVITRSTYYGLFLALHDPRTWFKGLVVGARNWIPGSDAPDGNILGSVFPEELAFLMTDEGGVYVGR